MIMVHQFSACQGSFAPHSCHPAMLAHVMSSCDAYILPSGHVLLWGYHQRRCCRRRRCSPPYFQACMARWVLQSSPEDVLSVAVRLPLPMVSTLDLPPLGCLSSSAKYPWMERSASKQ